MKTGFGAIASKVLFPIGFSSERKQSTNREREREREREKQRRNRERERSKTQIDFSEIIQKELAMEARAVVPAQPRGPNFYMILLFLINCQ